VQCYIFYVICVIELSSAVNARIIACGTVCREIQSKMMISQSCEELSLVIEF